MIRRDLLKSCAVLLSPLGLSAGKHMFESPVYSLRYEDGTILENNINPRFKQNTMEYDIPYSQETFHKYYLTKSVLYLYKGEKILSAWYLESGDNIGSIIKLKLVAMAI